MKILTSILTYSRSQVKADACLDTWIQNIKPPHDYFFYGDKFQSQHMDKTWDCTPNKGEERHRLPEKTYKMLIKSLDYDWDFLFKCDDDTYVVFDKLVNLLKKYNPSEDLYIGQQISMGKMCYAQGGAGYILTRTAVQKCLNSFRYLKSAEDYSVGASLFQEGVRLQHEKLLYTPDPRSAKDQRICLDSIVNRGKITTHYVQPFTMRTIYESE